jgi:hypothetical protein
MKILIGSFEKTFYDVTFPYMIYNLKNMKIHIPADSSARCRKIGDPFPDTPKTIVVIDESGQRLIVPPGITVDFELTYSLKSIPPRETRLISNDLDEIHRNLRVFMASFDDELPEQQLAVKYVQPSAKVLELGANVGRNTMVIASILEDDRNLVTLDCNKNFIDLLTFHRNINRMRFHIECAALSYRPLLIEDWDTRVVSQSESNVNCVTFDYLRDKYFDFDTLVADCEGALFYILSDNPTMLSGFHTIIMENDYHDINHYNYVRSILEKEHSLVEAQEGGWGPCQSNFYEVWQK